MSIFVGILAGEPFEALESILTDMGRVIYELGLIIVWGSIIGMRAKVNISRLKAYPPIVVPIFELAQ